MSDKKNPFAGQEQEQNNENVEVNINDENVVEFKEKEEKIDKTSEQSETELETVSAEEHNKLKEELEKVKAQYLRMAADFDNNRKRFAQERQNLLDYGAVETLKKMLPVIDTFHRAEKAVNESEDPKTLKESFEIVKKQFSEVLNKAGLEKIEAQGKEFDPNFHEAVMQTPSEEHPDQTVIQEMQSGYKVKDKVIRPALVNVSVSE